MNARYVHSCLALFYLRNELERHLPGAEVDILQLTINDNGYERLLRITADRPFAVFFSAAIWNSDQVAQLVGEVRGCLPDCRIVVGGPQAAVLRHQLAAELCSVVVGEIEAVDSQFYADLIAGRLRPSYAGRFLHWDQKTLQYPFRDEDFAEALANRHIYYESSRGCPHACTYCLSGAEMGLYHKPLAQVEAELEHILRHNPRVVRFVDRTFNDIPARALAIWRFLLARDGQTLFHFEIAPERFSEEMFDFLATVGCGRLQFEIGVQSTNRTTLAAIRRRMDIDEVGPIVSRLARLDTIHLHVDLILGLPHEDYDSFASSFREVFAMGPHYIQMGLLKILPGSPISERVERHGYIHSSAPPYPVLANSWLDHAELAELYWFCECVEKFHNNRFFTSLWRYLRTSGDDIFVFFCNLLTAGRRIDLFYRAATQQTLTACVVEATAGRADESLVRELLRYDWLRCGQRRLPDCLADLPGEESPEATRDILYRQLPETFPGLYEGYDRNQFFKRSTFLRLSARAAVILGLAQSGVRLAVVTERESTVRQYNEVVVLASC
ncbi:MAG: DUF4080 domain-containing protein [Desulfopila sp.]